MRSFWILLAALFAAAGATAQVEPCGTMPHLQQQIAENPGLAPLLEQMEQAVQQRLSDPAFQQKESGSVITIPVVVHVVYKTAAQNISYAQIQSQLDVLNEDFRRHNADTSNTLNVFKPVAGDAQIEFCLAVRDPNNNPTSGITRTQTNVTVFGLNDEVKHANQGGHNAWPASDYLNIWVCNLTPGIGGYAQFPGMNQNTDGVVIDYQYFGRYPDNPFNSNSLGRTATHEVGHWLNLRHIWGDGPCGQDDFVNDTPLSDAPNYGCPILHQSCGSLDMVQNYMDYTDDDCMNIFTQGQANRMRDALFNLRPGLLNSLGCSPVTAPPMVDFSADKTTACLNDTVQFFDESLNFPTSWQWTFPGGNPSFSTLEKPKVVYTSVGTYSVKLVATNQYGTDSLVKTSYVTITGATDSLPQQQSFEDSQFLLDGWSVFNPDGDRTWERVTGIGAYGNSNACIKFTNFGSGPDPTGTMDQYRSPLIDFSALNNPYLTFDVAYARFNSNYSDTLVIYYSTDCGNSFIPVWSKGGSQLATAPDKTVAFIPNASQWRKDSVNLSSLVGYPAVSIAIGNKSGWGNNLYIDNILLNAQATTAPVALFTANKTVVCAGDTVQFTDLSSNYPSSWAWSFTGGNAVCTDCKNPEVVFTTAGQYTVKLVVSNSIGTDSTEQLNYIQVNPAPSVSLNKTNVICNGTNTGSITAQVTGGTPPYAYSWSNGASTATTSSLAAGLYIVTVTDSLGCTAVKHANITEPSGMVLNTITTSATNGKPNGTATVGVLGGKPPYSYLWDDTQHQTTAQATGLTPGTYHVTVTDADNCQKIASATVGNIVGMSSPDLELNVKLYPNPAGDKVWIDMTLSEPEKVLWQFFDATGRLLETGGTQSAYQLLESIDVSGLPNGLYIIRITAGAVVTEQKLSVLR